MQEKSDRHVITSRLPRQMLNRQTKVRQVEKPHSNNFETYDVSKGDFHKSNIPNKIELADEYWESIIGQPVCISGVKEGVLRYYGKTKFADGLWCGVELNEPVGKNNGTVNGIYYFACKPNHGIFAPVSKITLLSPSKSDATLDDDYNPFQKRRRPASFHEEHQNFSFIKQSSSDPNFQRRHSVKNSYLSYSSHDSAWYGDKRCLTEQRELNLQQIPEGCKRAQLCLPFPLKSSSNLLENVSLVPKPQNRYSSEKKNSLNYTNQSVHSTNYFRQSTSPSKLYSSRNTFSESSTDFDNLSNYGNKVSKEDHSLKHYNDMYSEEKNTEFSSETKDDDDDLSVEYDESLGILSPSQMRDFTLCGDLSTSCSEIARAIDFPSSESFDDVNELPEDEVAQDVSIQYMSSCASSVISSVKVTQSNIVDSVKTQHMLHELKHNNKPLLSCTEQFLLNVSSDTVTDVNLDIQRVDSVSPDSSMSKTFKCSKEESIESNSVKETIDSNQDSSSAGNLKSDYEDKAVLNKINVQLSSHEHVSENESSHEHVSENESSHGHVSESESSHEKCVTVVICESDVQKSPIANDQDELILKEKTSVSWEECIVQSSDKICTKDERPESIYTVSSCDTGYQDDGEEDLDAGMTISIDSTKENKKLSALSRDSGVIMEDIDPLKAVESASTSGYSTGLSDSYYNDRQEEECSRHFMEDSYRDVQDSYHSDDGLLDAPISSSIDENAGVLPEKSGFFDMDSYKETETNTEFQITESNTILGLDSTCKSFTEDENAFDQSTNVTVISSDTNAKEVFSIADKEKKVSNESSQKLNHSSPEKKPEKICVPKKSEMEKNPTAVERNDTDAKKQILKSPKRKVIAKIKSAIENSTSKTKNEVIDSEKKNSPVKKQSRWGSVTSKIAASLADEKSKVKPKKEIKGKVDTNLAAARQACKSPKSEHSSLSERVPNVSVQSPTFARTRKMHYENQANTSWCNRASHMGRVEQNQKSPRPGKTCCSPRSASPVTVSECSTTSHTTSSHHSKSKIAVWKGSSNAVGVASPVAPPTSPLPPVKKPFMGGALRLIGRVNRIQSKDAIKEKQGEFYGKIEFHKPLKLRQ